MAISRVPGAALLSDLDRQGVDLEFSTLGNTLVYMDFANFYVGINEASPTSPLTVRGDITTIDGNLYTSGNLSYSIGSESNRWNEIYAGNVNAINFITESISGTLTTGAQPNITSLGNLTSLVVDGNLITTGTIQADSILPTVSNSSGTIGNINLWYDFVYSNSIYSQGIYGTILTEDQYNITNLGNINVQSITVGGNISLSGNTSGGIINADELYEAGNRVLTQVTNISISGDATGTGTYSNIPVTLANSGVVAETYGSNVGIAQITFDEKGRATSADTITLNRVGNINVDDTTITTVSGDITVSSNVANLDVTGTVSADTVTATEIYEAGNQVLTDNSNIQITGDAVGYGTSSNVAVQLADTGVVAGIYGSADDEIRDSVPKITVDSKGRITNIANVTLTQLGNITFTDTTISTASADLVLSAGSGVIDVDSNNLTNLADPVLDSDAVNLGYLNSAISATGSEIFADDTSVTVNDDGINPGNIEVIVDNTSVALIDETTTEFYNNVIVGQTTLSGNTISSSGNLVLEPTNILYINTTSAMWLPTGNEVERPSNPEIGYFRYNTERESIEYWDGNTWTVPGQATITSDIIDPDGVTDTYTLSIETTDDAVLVSINGTLQQPTTAYSITGNSIQFSEVPLTTDKIEVRHMTTAAALSQDQIVKGSGSIAIVNGNANVTASLIPTANVTYDLGTNDFRWRDLYLAGNTIVMGNLTLSDDGGVLTVLDSDGFEAPLSAADPVADTDVVTLGYLNTELSGLSSSGLVADDTEIAINDDGVDPGNVEVIVDGANVALFTETEVTFYANVVAQSITNDITTANTAMQGYVDSAVNSANVGLKGYVDGEITTVGTDITTANTAMQGYVDDAVSTLTANAAVQAGAIADTNTAITTANTAMQGYVDNEISSLIDSAPDALNTLNELAAALGDDANLSTTLTTMISNVESNVSTLQSDVTTLTANAAVQAGAIADTNTAITTANTAMKGYVDAINSTLTSNAAVQAGAIATLTSNAAVQAGAIADTISSVTTANTAMRGYVDNATDLDNLLPSGEQTGYVLKTSGAGTYYWSAESGGGSVVGQELNTLRQSNTATSGQTIFTLVDGKTYTPGAGQLRVYINGVRQFPDAYTETSSTVYTLSTGVNAGTIVFAEIDQFSSFNNYANLTYASNIGNIAAVGLTVQSAIENLENDKATLADPVFTGTPTAPTASSGTNTTQIATTAFVQTANVGLKGYTDSQLSSKANLASPTFSGNITVSGNVKFTGWHVYETNNTLYFAFGGNVKMSLNTSGNLTVSGDVTGFGTP